MGRALFAVVAVMFVADCTGPSGTDAGVDAGGGGRGGFGGGGGSTGGGGGSTGGGGDGGGTAGGSAGGSGSCVSNGSVSRIAGCVTPRSECEEVLGAWNIVAVGETCQPAFDGFRLTVVADAGCTTSTFKWDAGCELEVAANETMSMMLGGQCFLCVSRLRFSVHPEDGGLLGAGTMTQFGECGCTRQYPLAGTRLDAGP